MSIQGTLVIPVQDVASPYITIKVTISTDGLPAPIHIVNRPRAIHISVRTVPAVTNIGIFLGIGSTTREINTWGHAHPIRINAPAKPTITLDVLNVCTNAGRTKSELTNVIADIIRAPFATSSQKLLFSLRA